jgi:hypothetical protein
MDLLFHQADVFTAELLFFQFCFLFHNITNMPTVTDSAFDLFGEISPEEQCQLDQRQKTFQQNLEAKLAKLPSDPSKRSMSENRMVFTHNRGQLFGIPGIRSRLLSRLECQHVLDICAKQSNWTTDRHSAFPTTDIPIRSNTDLQFLEPLVKERLFVELANYYRFNASDLEFRDIFLVQYAAHAQRGLKLHTDGCLFSLTLLISHENDFEGGGTYYQSIDKVIHLEQGDCAYHDARVMHSGIDITKGSRYILVAFIDTVDTVLKDQRANKATLRSE